MKDFEGFLFDLDGTIVYVPKFYTVWAVNRTLELLKVGQAKERECIDFWYARRPRDDVIQESFNVDVKAFWETFNKVDVVRKNYVRAYEDAGEVNKLRNKGKRVALITGAPKHILDAECSLVKANFEFKIMANNGHNYPEKPHPAALLEGISRFGLPKEEVCYVGNSGEDIQFARNADVYSIIVERGIGYKLYPDGMEPDRVIKSLNELLDL